MALAADLERIAASAATHGVVLAVLAAEPASGRRLYLVAVDIDAERRWAVLDDAGALVERREEVRDAASIVAMCELAEDLAGGGDLEELRSKLAQLRIVERPAGIEEAEEGRSRSSAWSGRRRASRAPRSSTTSARRP